MMNRGLFFYKSTLKFKVLSMNKNPISGWRWLVAILMAKWLVRSELRRPAKDRRRTAAECSMTSLSLGDQQFLLLVGLPVILLSAIHVVFTLNYL